MTEALEYWAISIPNGGNAPQQVNQLKKVVESQRAEHYLLSNLPIKQLRVGTLDKLISLSDDLGRIDNTGKTVVEKLHKTFIDLENTQLLQQKKEQEMQNNNNNNMNNNNNNNNNNMNMNDDQPKHSILSVYNKSIRNYITNFSWDEGHFNPHSQLRDLVQSINNNMLKTAEHLRKWTSLLSEIEASLQAIERKKTGTLMNKSLADYIKKDDWYDGEYIRSALVVIPNIKKEEFLEKYEFMEDTDANQKYIDMFNAKHASQQPQQQQQQNKDDNNNEQQQQPPQPPQQQQQQNENNKFVLPQCRFVVPESHKLLYSDSEFSLYQVLILKTGYEWYKYVCLNHGFNVRDFDIKELESNNDEKHIHDLKKKKQSQQKKLKLFCQNTFSETFSNWMHLKVIRAFVESVLRFGLPVDFSISMIKPFKGSEKRLLKSLESQYMYLIDKKFQGKSEENEVDFTGLSNDFYPFVFVKLRIEL